MSGRENREGQTAKKTTQQRVRQREKGADRVKEIQRERERERQIFLTTDAHGLKQNAPGENINAAVQSFSYLLSFSISLRVT